MDLKACLQLLLMLLAPLALLLSPRRRNQQALEQLGRDLLAELRDLRQSPALPPLADRPLPVPPPQEPPVQLVAPERRSQAPFKLR